MDDQGQQFESLGRISGPVRLLPFPNLVMFPRMFQTVRFAETRHLRLLEEALSKDRLIATALLRAGWEADYDERPPIHDALCACRVKSVSHRDDASANALVVGLARLQFKSELEESGGVRRANVSLIEESAGISEPEHLPTLFEEVLQTCQRVSGFRPPTILTEMGRASGESLGLLVDSVAFSSELPLAVKQELLGESDIARRAERLIGKLEEAEASGGLSDRPHPPGFSEN